MLSLRYVRVMLVLHQHNVHITLMSRPQCHTYKRYTDVTSKSYHVTFYPMSTLGFGKNTSMFHYAYFTSVPCLRCIRVKHFSHQHHATSPKRMYVVIFLSGVKIDIDAPVCPNYILYYTIY